MQKRHKDTAIGAYPRYDGANYSTQIVVRSRDAALLDAAETDVRAMLAEISRSP